MRSDRIVGTFVKSSVLMVPAQINEVDLRSLVDTGAAYRALRTVLASPLAVKADLTKTISVQKA